MPDPDEYSDQAASQEDPARDSSGDDVPLDPLIEILSSLSEEIHRPAEKIAGPDSQVVFTLQHDAAYRMSYRVSGPRAEQGSCASQWSIDFGSLNLQLRDMGRFLASSHRNRDDARHDVWLRAAEQLGCHMYDGLLAVDRRMAAALKRVQRWTRPPQRLTLVFAGPEAFLSVPYELLVDSTTHEALALHHPLCRQVTDAPRGDGWTWCQWIADLQQRGETLRVLLISSGAEQIGATDEISALEALFDSLGGQVSVDLMLAGDAGSEGIRARLRACSYHVVHYVGQIYHDEQHPAQSGMLFAARQEAQLGQVVVDAAELGSLLAGGATQMVYLSAEIERAERDVPALRTGDDFDMLRAIIAAGVPYAAGLRWYVPPAERQRLAVRFYTHLLDKACSPEVAMLCARQDIAYGGAATSDGVGAIPDGTSWTAPVLIAQNVDLGGN